MCSFLYVCVYINIYIYIYIYIYGFKSVTSIFCSSVSVGNISLHVQTLIFALISFELTKPIQLYWDMMLLIINFLCQLRL